jgi:DNA (cytosine-5)-methyltransferase 1
MIGIDLFSGAGGMALGAKMAGIYVQTAVECDLHAAATYAHNFPGTHLITSDIRQIKKFSINSFKKQTVIFGGPPCQGFSTSNQRTRSAENPSNWLFREFARAVNICKPDWIVFENVKGLLETENGLFLDKIIKSFKKLGYAVSYGVLNAADFGVPQYRSRLFVLGSLHGIELPLPTPQSRAYISVDDAIADLPSLSNGMSYDWLDYKSAPKSNYAKVMREGMTKSPNHLVTKSATHIIKRFQYVPQGGNWENIPVRLMKNYTNSTRCHTGIYHRLKAAEPSIVIGNYRKNMLIHPYEHRGLSVREAARLQTFPDWFEFKGSIGFQQQQVGNAVPPLLAKAIFKQIIKASV